MNKQRRTHKPRAFHRSRPHRLNQPARTTLLLKFEKGAYRVPVGDAERHQQERLAVLQDPCDKVSKVEEDEIALGLPRDGR